MPSDDDGMSEKLRTLKQRRDDLEEAIHSGVQSVSTGGVTTTFASMRDMRSVLAELNAAIARLEGSDHARPKASRIYLGGF